MSICGGRRTKEIITDDRGCHEGWRRPAVDLIRRTSEKSAQRNTMKVVKWRARENNKRASVDATRVCGGQGIKYIITDDRGCHEGWRRPAVDLILRLAGDERRRSLDTAIRCRWDDDGQEQIINKRAWMPRASVVAGH